MVITDEDNATKSPKKKSTAILLCFLLGFLGAHRFYVGKIKSGGFILFLSVISATSFGVIAAIYDFFTLIFTNKFTDADGLPLR